MNNQEISAALEIISFFFVGIDLYGPERLRKAQERILAITEKLYTKIGAFRDFEWKSKRAQRFMRIIYAITVVIEIWSAIFHNTLKFDISGIADVIQVIIMALLYFCLLLFVELIVLSILILLLILMIEIMNIFVKGMIRLFRLYQMEGMFLFIGTLLFLASKYVQLYL